MKFDEEFLQLMKGANDLNPHITISRYPDSCFMIPDEITAKALVMRAEHIVYFIKNKMKIE